MNRPEAELLLGGYATGTLTEAEKRVLFAAALEHQELFDALLEEEVLRELLADPEVRQRLLAVLAPPEVRNVKPLWRRPAFLGVAASFFVLATTSLLVWRSPGYRVLPVAQEDAAPSPLPAAVAQDTSEPPVPLAAVRKPASPAKAKAPGKPAKAAAEEGSIAPGPMAPSQPVLEKQARQEPEGGTAAAERMAAPEPFFREKAETDLGAAAAKGNLAAAPRALKAAPPGFRSILEPLGGGRSRLTVFWGPRGYLYVLQRTPSGATGLSPRDSAPGEGGKTRSLFELTLGAKDALDVYVLAAPVAEPAVLPETGAVQGERRRVYPE